MFITNNQLYYDTFNFFYHKIKLILTISIISALITSNIDYYIVPDIKNIYMFCINKSNNTHSLINMVQEITPEQQTVLFKYSIIRSITSLIGNTFLIFSIVMLVNLTASKKLVNYNILYKEFLFVLPHLFLLILLVTCIVQFGFILLVIPGVLCCILLSLSPIILITEKVNLLTAIKKSSKITYNYIRILSPSIVIWLFSKFLLLTLDAILNILPGNFFIVILNTLINLITCTLIIYLYRFYMLYSSS